MNEAGVLAQVLPQVQPLSLFQALCDVTTDPVLRLSALLPADAAAVADVAGDLRLSNAQRDRLTAAVEDGPAVTPDMSVVRRARPCIDWGAGRSRIDWRGQRPCSAATGRACVDWRRTGRRPVCPSMGAIWRVWASPGAGNGPPAKGV